MVEKGSMVRGLYRLLQIVGKGGMGSVYKAEKITTHEIVAIKFMNPEFVEDETSMERFKREIETLKSLRHPNVVNIFDWFIPAEGQTDPPYVVMEFLEGESLIELLRRDRTMSVADSVTVMIQVIDALATAHEREIIHRDMGPQNVFLVKTTEDKPRVKLLDFGLAKSTEKSAQRKDLTKVGTLLGRVTYAAPEHFIGRSIDARSDIFSCGMMMMRMLTGGLPYKESSVAALLGERRKDCQTDEEYISARELNAEVPPMLDKIVARAIRKKPGDRYQKAREMLLDLSDVERDLGASEDATSVYISRHTEELVRFIGKLQNKVAEKEGEEPGAGEMDSEGITEAIRRDLEGLPIDVEGETEVDAKSVAAPDAKVEQTGETEPTITTKFSGKSRRILITGAVAVAFLLLAVVAGAILLHGGFFRGRGKSGAGAGVKPEPVAEGPGKAAPGEKGAGPLEPAAASFPEKIRVVIRGAPKGAVAKMGNQVLQGDALEGYLPGGPDPVVLEVSAPGYVTYVKSIIPDRDLEISVDMAQSKIQNAPPVKEGEAAAVEEEKETPATAAKATSKVAKKKQAKKAKSMKKKEKTIKGKFGTSINADYDDE